MTDQIIKTNHNGIAVEGKVVHQSARDYTIEITKPFHNLAGGLHIPYFSRATFIGKHGDECLLHTLNDLYRLGSYVEENIVKLQAGLSLVDQKTKEVSEHKITKEAFREIRLKSRKALKAGDISARYHQKILKWWQREIDLLETEVELHIIDPFFEKNFPMIVPYSTRDQVIDILRNKEVIQRGAI